LNIQDIPHDIFAQSMYVNQVQIQRRHISDTSMRFKDVPK